MKPIDKIRTAHQAETLAAIANGEIPKNRSRFSQMKAGGLLDNQYTGVWLVTEKGHVELETFVGIVPETLWGPQLTAYAAAVETVEGGEDA